MVGEPLTGAAPTVGRVVVDAEVSSADQKPGLDRQVARVTVWATGQGLAVDGRRAAEAATGGPV